MFRTRLFSSFVVPLTVLSFFISFNSTANDSKQFLDKGWTELFKDNDIEDENRNNDSEGEESGEESTFEGESADKSECAELMEFL